MLKDRSSSLLSSSSVNLCRYFETEGGRYFLNAEVGKAGKGQEPGSTVRLPSC